MVIWITGLAGSGKTAIGRRICDTLRERKSNIIFLDGDILRNVIGDQAGYSSEERLAKSKLYSRLCKMLSDQGLDVICCAVSMFDEVRDWNGENLQEYFEVFLDTPLEILIKRDKNGIYSAALSGEIEDVMGVNAEYERPKNPDLTLPNDGTKTIESAVKSILKHLELE